MKAQPIIQPADVFAAGYTNEAYAKSIYDILYECQNQGVFDQTITSDERTELIHIAAQEIRRRQINDAIDATMRKVFPNYEQRKNDFERLRQRVADINNRDPNTGLREGQTYTFVIAQAGVPDIYGNQFSAEALHAMEGESTVRFVFDKSQLDKQTLSGIIDFKE